MTNKNGNAKYSSDVFSMLLQDKNRALEIYNAMNGTILDANLSLYEHQSTYCPNMPLRHLIYIVGMLQKRAYSQKRDLYGKTLLKIAVPHFVVFYNGKEHAPEQYELRLSDAFEHKTDTPELELVCRVYNINKGNNTELLEKSPTLREYMFFVDLVREYHAKNDFSDLEIAIKQAIDQCIRENVLKDFLIQHREEVTHMMTMDYTFERRLELQREEAIEEGRELKLHEQIRKKLLKSKSLEQVADELEETLDAIRPLYEQIKEEMADTNFVKD